MAGEPFRPQDADLGDPGAVAVLLDRLHEAGADKQAAELARRAVAHGPQQPDGRGSSAPARNS